MKYFITLISALVATNVYADAKNFEGFSVELGAGYQKTDTKSTGIDIDKVPTAGYSLSSMDESDDFYTVGATYSHAISDDYLMGIGFDYSLNDIDTGSPKFYFPGGAVPYTKTSDYELKNMYSLFVKPQFVISDKQLAYVKLGYVHANLDYSDKDSEYISTRDTDLDGYLAGVGYRHNFDKKIYGFVEANYVKFNNDKIGGNYNDGSDYTLDGKAKLDAYNLKVGIGYQF